MFFKIMLTARKKPKYHVTLLPLYLSYYYALIGLWLILLQIFIKLHPQLNELIVHMKNRGGRCLNYIFSINSKTVNLHAA